jgi:hypothetical protein
MPATGQFIREVGHVALSASKFAGRAYLKYSQRSVVQKRTSLTRIALLFRDSPDLQDV